MNKEITVNISEYLSEEEIKQVAIDSLAYQFNRQLSNININTVLANLSHEYVFKAVVDSLGANSDLIEQQIINGIKEALKPDTIKYQVFRRKDAWQKTESPAVSILDDVLKNCRPKIEEMVNTIIEQYQFSELREEIEDTIYGCICRKLRECGVYMGVVGAYFTSYKPMTDNEIKYKPMADNEIKYKLLELMADKLIKYIEVDTVQKNEFETVYVGKLKVY